MYPPITAHLAPEAAAGLYVVDAAGEGLQQLLDVGDAGLGEVDRDGLVHPGRGAAGALRHHAAAVLGVLLRVRHHPDLGRGDSLITRYLLSGIINITFNVIQHFDPLLTGRLFLHGHWLHGHVSLIQS